MNDRFQFCPTRNHHYLDISYIKNQLMTKASSIHTIQSERQVCGTAVTLLHPVPECPVQVPPLLLLSRLPANVLRRGNGCSSFVCSLLKCLGKQQRMAEVAGSRRNFWARAWPTPSSSRHLLLLHTQWLGSNYIGSETSNEEESKR